MISILLETIQAILNVERFPRDADSNPECGIISLSIYIHTLINNNFQNIRLFYSKGAILYELLLFFLHFYLNPH